MTDTRDVTKAETNRIVQHLSGMTPYTLARIADCADPDTRESSGALFLTGVRDALVDAIESNRGVLDPSDEDATEIADGAPSIYTQELWKQFVDLAAWQEDISDWGPVDGDDLERVARIALYSIARRLVAGLIEEVTA